MLLKKIKITGTQWNMLIQKFPEQRIFLVSIAPFYLVGTSEPQVKCLANLGPAHLFPNFKSLRRRRGKRTQTSILVLAYL